MGQVLGPNAADKLITRIFSQIGKKFKNSPWLKLAQCAGRA